MIREDESVLTGLTPNGVHTGWRMRRRGRVVMTHIALERQLETESQGNTQLLATIAHDRFRVSPAVVVPARENARARFVALARWEGAVLEVFESYFSAEVVRLDADERTYVEFDLADLSAQDRPLCEPGALFYWSVGYDVKSHGSRARASLVVFRRLPTRAR